MSNSKETPKGWKKKQMIKVLSYNIQGLENKLDYLGTVISSFKIKPRPTVICLQEHFVTQGSEVILNSLEGYKCASSFCRQQGEKGGGVCILIKNEEGFEEITILPSSSEIEITAIKTRNVVIVNIHNLYSRKTLFIKKMTEIFNILQTNFEGNKTVIAGDFNINNSHKSGLAKEFRQEIKRFNYRPLFITDSTTKKDTCLDNFITNTGGKARVMRKERAFHFPILGEFELYETEDSTHTGYQNELVELSKRLTNLEKINSQLLQMVIPSASNNRNVIETVNQTRSEIKDAATTSSFLESYNNQNVMCSSPEISRPHQEQALKSAQKSFQEIVPAKSVKRAIPDERVKAKQFERDKKKPRTSYIGFASRTNLSVTQIAVDNIPNLKVVEKSQESNYEIPETSFKSLNKYRQKPPQNKKGKERNVRTDLLKKLHENPNITISRNIPRKGNIKHSPSSSTEKRKSTEVAKLPHQSQTSTVSVEQLPSSGKPPTGVSLKTENVIDSIIISDSSSSEDEVRPLLNSSIATSNQKVSNNLKQNSMPAQQDKLNIPTLTVTKVKAHFNPAENKKKSLVPPSKTLSGHILFPLFSCNMNKKQSRMVKSNGSSDRKRSHKSNLVQTMTSSSKLSSTQQEKMYVPSTNDNHVDTKNGKQPKLNNPGIKPSTVTKLSRVKTSYPQPISSSPPQRDKPIHSPNISPKLVLTTPSSSPVTSSSHPLPELPQLNPHPNTVPYPQTAILSTPPIHHPQTSDTPSSIPRPLLLADIRKKYKINNELELFIGSKKDQIDPSNHTAT